MSGVTLKFANEIEYSKFIEQVKQDVLKEMKPEPSYSPTWITIRDEIEHLLRGDYNKGCGSWYQNQQGLYATFRLAFKKDRVMGLREVESETLWKFYTELFQLINKYRSESNESIDGI